MQIEYEMKCCDLRWKVPVRVQLTHGKQEDIHGPYEALNCLTHRWPERDGTNYERARQLCMAAMGRRIPAETVREAFLAACAEAGIEPVLAADMGMAQRHDEAARADGAVLQ